MRITFETALDYVKQHPKLVVAEDYELVSHKREQLFTSFKNGEAVEESKNSFDWIQLRILHRKRPGVASTVFCEEKSLNELVDKAFEIAENSPVDPWFRFPLWKPTASEVRPDFDEGENPPTFNDGFLKSLFPNLVEFPVGLEERYFWQREIKTILRKTEKNFLRDISEIQKLQFFLVNRGRDDFYRINENRGSSFPFKSKEDFLESIMRKGDRLKSARAVHGSLPGKYVLNGSVMSSILKSVESHFWGTYAVQGRSCLSDFLGKRVFSEKVFLKDDALISHGEGNQRFDLEGSAARPTILVEGGVLKTFLHDATSAARYNRGSTGNLVLSDRNIPSVGVTNLYLVPSDNSPMELFHQMGEGAYIECLDKMSNEMTRDGKLELVGHGWRVERGEPVEPLSHIFLIVDPIEILKQISLVANDLDFWGRYGAPSVFLNKMP